MNMHYHGWLCSKLNSRYQCSFMRNTTSRLRGKSKQKIFEIHGIVKGMEVLLVAVSCDVVGVWCVITFVQAYIHVNSRYYAYRYILWYVAVTLPLIDYYDLALRLL